MPGLVPGIHVFLRNGSNSWMAGTRPAMTKFVLRRYGFGSLHQVSI